MTDDREKLARQLAEDVRATFTKFDAGKRVYEWLEKLCLKDSQTFSADPYMSAFNAGAREIILRIDDKIAVADNPPKPTETEN
jgi:hypothetical protein